MQPYKEVYNNSINKREWLHGFHVLELLNLHTMNDDLKKFVGKYFYDKFLYDMHTCCN
jgi:hypothetical protein